MTTDAANSPGGPRCGVVTFRLASTMATAACAMALCACGSSDGGTGVGATSATGNASPLGLSRCMRAHGISSFPDPGNGPGGQGLSISKTPGSPALTVQGITFSGPAFQKAEQACKSYLTPSGPPPQLSASQKAAMLKFAKCMRAHGVPDFADPTTAPGAVVSTKRPTQDVGSPSFRHAVESCGRPPGLHKR